MEGEGGRGGLFMDLFWVFVGGVVCGVSLSGKLVTGQDFEGCWWGEISGCGC